MQFFQIQFFYRPCQILVHNSAHSRSFSKIFSFLTDDVFTPPFVELSDCDIATKKARLAKAGLTFPIGML